MSLSALLCTGQQCVDNAKRGPAGFGRSANRLDTPRGQVLPHNLPPHQHICQAAAQGTYSGQPQLELDVEKPRNILLDSGGQDKGQLIPCSPAAQWCAVCGRPPSSGTAPADSPWHSSSAHLGPPAHKQHDSYHPGTSDDHRHAQVSDHLAGLATEASNGN